MSIALSTLTIFFLLIPGIVFRRFYYSEEFSKEYFKQTFFGVFISTILPSFLFQFIWYFLALLFGRQINLYVFANIVSGSPLKIAFENVQHHAFEIVIYNLTMFVAAAYLGHFFKNFIRNKKWDKTFKFFRFQNSWHYILKGEFFDFPRTEIFLERDNVEDIEFVFIDAVMELGGQCYIYDGILVDYELTGDGGLATISIRNTQRRKLVDDAEVSKSGKVKDNSKRYYPVLGHILLLKYQELKNLNFTYYTLDKKDGDFTPRLVQ